MTSTRASASTGGLEPPDEGGAPDGEPASGLAVGSWPGPPVEPAASSAAVGETVAVAGATLVEETGEAAADIVGPAVGCGVAVAVGFGVACGVGVDGGFGVGAFVGVGVAVGVTNALKAKACVQ